MKNIPVIDLSQYENTINERICVELKEAYSSIGFATLVNHGIPAQLIDRLYEVSKVFFLLPLAVKEKLQRDTSNGYFPRDTVINTDRILNVEIKSQYETFVAVADTIKIYPELFPESVEGMREIVDEYFKKMSSLAKKITESFFKILGISGETASRYFSSEKGGMKLLHYPAPDEKTKIDSELAEHTDTDFLTLLTVGSTGFSGLQVRDVKTKEWINVGLEDKHAIIMNTGAYMEIISNGLIKSTLHRVTRVKKERFSAPFFYSTHKPEDIKSRKGCKI